MNRMKTRRLIWICLNSSFVLLVDSLESHALAKQKGECNEFIEWPVYVNVVPVDRKLKRKHRMWSNHLKIVANCVCDFGAIFCCFALLCFGFLSSDFWRMRMWIRCDDVAYIKTAFIRLSTIGHNRTLCAWYVYIYLKIVSFVMHCALLHCVYVRLWSHACYAARQSSQRHFPIYSEFSKVNII